MTRSGGLARRCLFAAALVSLFIVNRAEAAERLALVIGNAAYESVTPLDNPVNDATAMADRLRELDFDLVGITGDIVDAPATDLDEDGFLDAIEHFTERVRRTDDVEMAFVYYAGHGMQYDDDSYLLPVDVPGDDMKRTLRSSISLEEVLADLDGEAALTIAVFDACREIPSLEEETRSLGGSMASFRGLARPPDTQQQDGRIIAYSGGPGQLVADGDGEHSPYTEALLAAMDDPTLQVMDTFREAEYRFLQRHRGQAPEVFSHRVRPKTFYLSRRESAPITAQGESRSGGGGADDSVAETLPDQNMAMLGIEQKFWESVERINSSVGYESYLESFPDGLYADLARDGLQRLQDIVSEGFSPAAELPPPIDANPSENPSIGADTGEFEFLTAAAADLGTIRRNVCSQSGEADPDQLKLEASALFDGKYEYAGRPDQARGWALYLESIEHCSTAALFDIARKLERKRDCATALEYARLAAENGHRGALRLIGQIERKRTCKS